MTLASATGSTPSRSRETAGLALGLLGVAIFGGTLPATRVALEIFSPSFVTFGRAAVASVAAAVLLLLLRRRLPRADIPALAAAGVLLVFGFPIMSSIAMQTVPASHGGVVLGILPLTTSIFAALIAGERPSPLFWLCGVAGAALVVTFAITDNGFTLTTGDLWLMGAAVAASLGYVISGRLSQKMPGWEVISWALVLTAPVSIPATMLIVQPEYGNATASQMIAFLYLGFGSMFLGFFAWNIGLGMGGIARVSQVQLLQSFFTLTFSAALLGETIPGSTIVFAVAVVAVVMLGRKARVAR
nr:DMT family transporter [Mesorhizobium shangrilense]